MSLLINPYVFSLAGQPAGTVLAVDFTDSLNDIMGNHTVSLRGSASLTANGLEGVNDSGGVTVPDSDDFHFDGDFTVEWWGDYNGMANGLFMRQWVTTGNQRSWNVDVWGTSLVATVSNDGVYPANSADGELVRSESLRLGLANQGETHLAMVRNGNTLTLYRAGVNIAQTTLSIGSLNNSTADLFFGAHEGFCKGIRVVKGTALYTSDFTSPTSVTDN